jgi:hypothetical protein
MLEILVDIAEHGQSESARVNAADKILDRALGKAPQHVDVSALRHTEIVYRSAEEIRKALIDAGAPPVLLDLTVEDEDENEKKANLGENEMTWAQILEWAEKCAAQQRRRFVRGLLRVCSGVG